MRRLMMLVVALSLLAMPLPAFAQDATPAANESLSEPSTVYSTDGAPLGTIVVEQVVDPFTGWDPSSPPARGYRWVMAEVTLTAGERPWAYDSSGFQVIDTDGFIAPQNYMYLASDLTDPPVELPGAELTAGTSVTGSIYFQVFTSSNVAVIEYSTGSDIAVTVADFSSAGDGTAAKVVEISGSDGLPMASITLEGIVDPVEDYDPSSPPSRGFRYVGVVATITNTGDRPLPIDPSWFTVTDFEGFVSFYAYATRTSESQSILPDFGYDTIEPGGSRTGIVLFPMLTGAAVAKVAFAPGYERKIVIATFNQGDPYPEVDFAALPTPEPADPVCATVQTWIDSIDPVLSPVSEILDGVEALEFEAENTPAEMRSAATQIRATAEAMTNITAPEEAASAHQQIIDILGAMASQVEAMANAAEAQDRTAFDTAVDSLETTINSLNEPGPFADLLTRCDPDQ